MNIDLLLVRKTKTQLKIQMNAGCVKRHFFVDIFAIMTKYASLTLLIVILSVLWLVRTTQCNHERVHLIKMLNL